VFYAVAEPAALQEMVHVLKKSHSIQHMNLKPIEFDFDDSLQTDFIFAASALKAENYDIDPVARDQVLYLTFGTDSF